MDTAAPGPQSMFHYTSSNRAPSPPAACGHGRVSGVYRIVTEPRHIPLWLPIV